MSSVFKYLEPKDRLRLIARYLGMNINTTVGVAQVVILDWSNTKVTLLQAGKLYHVYMNPDNKLFSTDLTFLDLKLYE
jgi:hypothetical protein